MYYEDQQLVEYDKYCPKCKDKNTKEADEPCRECLNTPTNTWSHKPINFKEKE